MIKTRKVKPVGVIFSFLLIFFFWIATLPSNIPLKQKISLPKTEDNWKTVYATRIGLIGETTASGLIIKEDDIFVALPSRLALNKTVSVIYNNKQIKCRVLDVGPWSTQDPYWLNNETPLAELGKQKPERKRIVTNKAGIDLSDKVWDSLGIKRKLGVVIVKWKFENE